MKNLDDLIVLIHENLIDAKDGSINNSFYFFLKLRHCVNVRLTVRITLERVKRTNEGKGKGRESRDVGKIKAKRHEPNVPAQLPSSRLTSA